MIDATRLDQLLREGMPPLLARADGSRLRALADGFRGGQRPAVLRLSIRDEELRLELVDYMREELRRQLAEHERLRGRMEQFRLRFSRAITEREKHQHILDLARDLGANRARLRGDRAAFRRWFAEDAVIERGLRQAAACERMLALLLDRIALHGRQLMQLLAASGHDEELERCWRYLDLERALLPLFSHEGDARVRAAAFRCVGQTLAAMPAGVQGRAYGAETFRVAYNAALDRHSPVWVAAEAMRSILTMAPGSAIDVLVERLTRPPPPQDREDLFLRRRAVRTLGYRLRRLQDLSPEQRRALSDLLHATVDDPSPLVRQGAAEALALVRTSRSVALLREMALRDRVPQVRAAALLANLQMLSQDGSRAELQATVEAVLRAESDRFVLRTALHVVRQGHRLLVDGGRAPDAEAWLALVDAISQLHQAAPDLSVRRWAGQLLERLWMQQDAERRAAYERLAQTVQGLDVGGRRALDPAELRRQEPTVLGRLLSLLAEDDHGVEIEPDGRRPWLVRGHRFGMRLWRVLHEWRNPDTAKRQAHRHTIGRRFGGTLRAPSAILSELSETKVPGEPLYMAAEAGWRPYLPLMDEVLSSLRTPRALRIFTSEGVTTLLPPQRLRDRLRSYWRLSSGFPRYARLRNWREGESLPPNSYVAALQEAGFSVALEAHADIVPGVANQADPAVVRFFQRRATLRSALPLPLLMLWENFADYFVSLYQNTLRELFTFLVAMTAVFVGRHLYFNRKMQQARRSIPLVLGGWGSRGKSGTERLKAAVINALGYNTVSKTTGCEAMFLHGYAYAPLREMFLFRPYDKATIWEQVFVMRTAQQLGTEVFLWECMGLTPSYVNVLQKQWMRDDLSTLTNTYPDHEDIQGPAGINIPQVMTEFIPENSTLLTSEEQMLPILRDAAAAFGTRIRSVGWLEAGIIPPDVMSRFPYEEHPYNVALVTALADELGQDADFAWKEMADRVVADLGALKAYAAAPLRGRRLEYILGNSANERLAAMGNWVRMGLDRADPRQQPGVFVTTLVNNRADRVARSRVFAGMMVNDTPADLHCLIGSNVTGLYAFVKEEWAARMATTTLWPDAETPSSAVLERWANWLRVPSRPEDVSQRLAAMLGGAEPQAVAEWSLLWDRPEELKAALASAGLPRADEILQFAQRYADEYQACRAFAERLQGQAASPALDAEFKELLWRWFDARIYLFQDFHASGNHIIETICEKTPPGFHNRIMGMQNIKGTGLGHVYTWEAWEVCHRALVKLGSGNATEAGAGLSALAEFRDYNLLCEEAVRSVLQEFRKSPHSQNEQAQALLKLIELQFEAASEKLRSQSGAVPRGRLASMVDAIEAFLDAGDAVKRRKHANRIYRDLATQRIGHARAAKELQGLNKRQKGGWLWERIQKLLAPENQGSA